MVQGHDIESYIIIHFGRPNFGYLAGLTWYQVHSSLHKTLKNSTFFLDLGQGCSVFSYISICSSYFVTSWAWFEYLQVLSIVRTSLHALSAKGLSHSIYMYQLVSTNVGSSLGWLDPSGTLFLGLKCGLSQSAQTYLVCSQNIPFCTFPILGFRI